MNLHLMSDNKFLDNFIKVSEELQNNNNKYVVYKAQKDKHLKYIKSSEVEIKLWGTEKFDELVKKVFEYDKVFIHCLKEEAVEFINNLPPIRPKIYWIFYGFDFFTPQLFYNFLFDNKTKEIFWQNNKIGRYLPKIIFEKLYSLTKFKSKLKKAKAISQIDYFMHWNDKDLSFINKYYPNEMEFLEFNYLGTQGDMEYIEKLNNNASLDTNTNLETKILVGNSATPTNNHLDIYEILKAELCLKNFSIYSLLSYGSPKYKDSICDLGKMIFGDKFNPITDFMELRTFYKFLQTMNVGIFGSNRTQAAGNIFVLILLGKKVFLKKENTIFQMLKEKGLFIYSIEDINDKFLRIPLTKEQRKKNWDIVIGKFGFDQSKQKLDIILNK